MLPLARQLILTFSLVTMLTANAADQASSVIREEARMLSESYAAFRRSQVSNPAYHLALDLSGNSETFGGEVTIEFDLVADNSSPLTLDFDSGVITALSINGATGSYDYQQWFISIPATALQPGHNTIEIAYTRPYANDGAGLHHYRDAEDANEYLYTNFEPYDANRLFPHFDQPNLKAPLTLEVTAPANWQIIANTREADIVDIGNRRRWSFPATAAISSYIYAMHAGPYSVWEDDADGIPLRLFARASMASTVNPAEWFIPTQQSFAFYQDYFEVPYPFGKYDQIMVPDFNAGAMENVGAVTFNERYLSRGIKSTAQLRSLALVIAHEMAHMWFGDLVTMDWWNGLWLNESFATYMSYLALDRASEFDNIWDTYYSGYKLWAYEEDGLVTTHPIELAVPTTADAFSNFDGITYAKGGSVLRQLPFYIGEENFRLGVSNYLKSHSYGNTSLDDFVNELANASGMDLDQWRQQWLYESGTNTVRADFTCENDAISNLRLLQSVPNVSAADKVLRSQRTQLGFYRYTDNQMLAIATLPVTYNGAVTWVMEATGLPCPDLVIPNEDDWAYMKIDLDPVSRATLNEYINEIPNPTTRMMLWQSLWNSVEDTTLPLTDYLDFVLGNLAEENDDNVIRSVNGTLGSAFSYYTVFGNHADEMEAIQNFQWEQLRNAAPGSEPQKIWYDSFISHAHTPDALAFVEALLTDTAGIEGMTIDQDKRWTLVVALNRYRYGNYQALLEAEQARDSSDLGSNMALAAQASRPDADNKQSWLDIIINDTDRYRVANLRYIMSYLFPSEQTALLEPFREQILAALPQLDGSVTLEYLDSYVGYLDTATCTPESVSRLAQANREFTGLQPTVVKTLLIQHQNDERCLAIRNRLR